MLITRDVSRNEPWVKELLENISKEDDDGMNWTPQPTEVGVNGDVNIVLYCIVVWLMEYEPLFYTSTHLTQNL